MSAEVKAEMFCGCGTSLALPSPGMELKNATIGHCRGCGRTWRMQQVGEVPGSYQFTMYGIGGAGYAVPLEARPDSVGALQHPMRGSK